MLLVTTYVFHPFLNIILQKVSLKPLHAYIRTKHYVCFTVDTHLSGPQLFDTPDYLNTNFMSFLDALNRNLLPVVLLMLGRKKSCIHYCTCHTCTETHIVYQGYSRETKGANTSSPLTRASSFLPPLPFELFHPRNWFVVCTRYPPHIYFIWLLLAMFVPLVLPPLCNISCILNTYHPQTCITHVNISHTHKIHITHMCTHTHHTHTHTE